MNHRRNLRYIVSMNILFVFLHWLFYSLAPLNKLLLFIYHSSYCVFFLFDHDLSFSFTSLDFPPVMLSKFFWISTRLSVFSFNSCWIGISQAIWSLASFSISLRSNITFLELLTRCIHMNDMSASWILQISYDEFLLNCLFWTLNAFGLKNIYWFLLPKFQRFKGLQDFSCFGIELLWSLCFLH